MFFITEVQRRLGKSISLSVFIRIRSNLSTDTGIQGNTQTQVFPGYACSNRTHKLRNQATYFFSSAATLSKCRTIRITPCQYGFTIFILFRHCIRHQHTIRTTNNRNRTYTIVTVSYITFQGNIVCYVRVKFNDLVRVLCKCEVQCPFPVFVFERNRIQGNFNTGVLDITSIDQLFADT